MGKLSQAAAAWLLDTSPRSLRDWADCPRNADNTYNAKSLLAWSKGRLPAPALSDDDVERSLRAADELIWRSGMTGTLARSILGDIGRLRAAFGGAGVAAWAEIFLTALNYYAEEYDTDAEEPPRVDVDAVRREMEARARREQEEHAADLLERASVCEGCKRMRRGHEWVKPKAEPDFFMWTLCPACLRKT